MRDGTMHPVEVAGLPQDVVYSIDGASDGAGDDLWIARQEGGLTRLHGEGDQWSATSWTRANGLLQDSTYVARAIHGGGVWAASLTAGVSRITPHGSLHLDHRDGLLSDTVTAIEQDQDNVVWFGTPDGVSTWKDRTIQTFTTTQGLPSSDVISLLNDASGGMWIGTSGGLAFAEHERIQAFDSPLLNHTAILGMAVDREDLLWLSTTSRILSVPRQALLGHRLLPEMVRSYSLPDGLRSTDGVRRSRSVVRDPRGQVWISTNRGLAMTTLGADRPTDLPAIPHVESMLIDGTPVSIENQRQGRTGDQTLSVPAGSRRIAFGYAGLDLRSPERVRFCYRLDGFDRQWSRPVEEREVAYTNLPPGLYRFRVMASNSNGEWNSQESALAFRVDPMFWQRWEFQLVTVGALLLIFAWIYRARMQYMITQANMRFEERLIERTRIARELHDTLLQGFISAVLHLNLTADRLEQGSPILSSLQNSLRVMEKVIDQARDAVKGLRTFDGANQDLEQVFHDLFHEMEGESSALYEVSIEGDRVNLRPAVLEDVCLIGREAVINACRHAYASRILVLIRYTRSHLELEVRDDGLGMDPSTAARGREGHWGLLGMRERASRLGSRLQILSRPGAGTRIVLTIPAPVAFSSESDKPIRLG
jgi:signal transduction histidine kinase